MTKEFLLELAIYCLIVGISFSQAAAFTILCYRRVVRSDYVNCTIASIFWIAGVSILIYLGINSWVMAAAITPMLVGIMVLLIERHK
jgi:hypothetical protein